MSVQKVVVFDVDEKLRGGGIRHIGACHGHRATVVFQAVAAFKWDRSLGGLLLRVGSEAAALNHEVVDHAVENGVVVVPCFDVSEEVLDGLGGFGCVQLNHDVALRCDKLDPGCVHLRWWRGTGRGDNEQRGGCYGRQQHAMNGAEKLLHGGGRCFGKWRTKVPDVGLREQGFQGSGQEIVKHSSLGFRLGLVSKRGRGGVQYQLQGFHFFGQRTRVAARGDGISIRLQRQT